MCLEDVGRTGLHAVFARPSDPDPVKVVVKKESPVVEKKLRQQKPKAKKVSCQSAVCDVCV